MLKIDSIENGIVIDHIPAGRGMEVYDCLELFKLECSVAIIQRVRSHTSGTKDIIKIEDSININLDTLAFVVPSAVVNFIKNGKIAKKQTLKLPEKLVNVICCKNPRCITTVENDVDKIFILSNREKHTYKCIYCEKTND